jgi:hypothetical protein
LQLPICDWLLERVKLGINRFCRTAWLLISPIERKSRQLAIGNDEVLWTTIN